MAIGTTNVNLYSFREADGPPLRAVRIDVTGLASGNNTVPHGLKDQAGNGVVPKSVGIEPTSNGTFYEYQAADATSVYVNVGVGTGTTCSIYVEG
ncbi:MAG: hypothetical protein DMG22_16935 [Acidobacteria bacterium]|nr:MAG: hypothetical protein DMG22_16935 [Acidobacteriota bacterium]